MMEEITLVVTSCDRYDLLERTLTSFARHNTHPIAKTIIAEDGRFPLTVPSWLSELSARHKLGVVTIDQSAERKGQIPTIDHAYGLVKTPWIFHCEDDWEFLRGGFIEASLEIMQKWDHVLQCWIREDSTHPVVSLEQYPFPTMMLDWQGSWSGFAFNPGLRRLADYRILGSYQNASAGCTIHGCAAELKIGRFYRELGFVAASLRPAYVKHIGQGRSRACEHPSRWKKVEAMA